MRLKHNIDTQLVFQIGDPMEQGCANYLHNAMYEYANINAICMTTVVKKGELPAFIAAVKTLHANGFDLTMPHKTDIIAFLDECDPVSKAFKCVNHVKLENGRLIGTGLDGVGMGLAVEQALGETMPGRRALILGAGAVAGPIAADLCKRGITELIIANRTVDKAAYIAKTLKALCNASCTFGPLTDEFLTQAAPKSQLVIQCTSLGGGYGGEALPLGFVAALPENCLAADVLYPDTAFLAAAAARGLQTLDGRGMLFQQQLAAIAFRFGIRLPEQALLEAEEAVEIAVAMRNLRNARLAKARK